MLFLKSDQFAEYPLTGVKQSNRRWFDLDLVCRRQGKVIPDLHPIGGKNKACFSVY